MNLKIKYCKFIFLLLISSIVFCSCQSQFDDSKISFSFKIFDEGKADAIVLRTTEHTVIIDTGEKGDGKDILEYLSENNITEVDYLFITHFDKDHVGGATKVINNIKINNIVTPDYVGNNSEYQSYMKAVSEKNITPTKLTQNMNFSLDDVSFEVFPPMKKSYDEDDNDFSLVISVIDGDNKFLFAGDAEEERIDEIFTQIKDLQYDFIKIPHHGRNSNNSKKFLEAINPQYAAITCSEKEPADDEVIDVLKSLYCETYYTTKGEIEVLSNGKQIQINQ